MSDLSEYMVKGDSAARQILSTGHIDSLGEAILALTGEVWILTDRLIVLEEVLKASGIDVAAAIEGLIPSVALEQKLDARRDRLIATVVTALQTARSNDGTQAAPA